jgi:hypothetical protein
VLLEDLQGGVEGTTIPHALRSELAHLLYQARSSLETQRPWFFPFPQQWQALNEWRATYYLQVFIAVIQRDQHSSHPQIPGYLASIGIQQARNIESLLGHNVGWFDFF